MWIHQVIWIQFENSDRKFGGDFWKGEELAGRGSAHVAKRQDCLQFVASLAYNSEFKAIGWAT